MTGGAAARRRSRRARARVAVLRGALSTLVLALASCGGDGEDVAADPEHGLVGQASRLTLQPASEEPGEWPSVRVARRLGVVNEVGRWAVEAPAYGLTHHPGVPQSDRTRAFAAGSGRAGPVRFVRRGAYDLRTFDAVRLAVSYEGAGSVRILLRSQGRVVAESARLEVPVHDAPTEVVLPLLATDPAATTADELVVDVPGVYRTLYLSEVAFLRHPLGARVPDPEHGARLHSFERDARRCVGLLAEHPVLARGLVRELGVVDADGDGVSDDDAGDAPGSLEVRVEDDGRLLASHALPLGKADDGWRRVELDLSDFAGRDVQLGFSLRGGRRVSAVLAEPWFVSGASDSRDDTAPTVLLVTSDTHRGDHVGAMGLVDVDTPALDALAARGLLFEDAWSTVNNTTPSHAALFTATHPRDTGVLDNFTRLAPEARTLAEAFAQAGFATWAAVSSGHLGPMDSGLGQGFDRVAWTSESARPSIETVEDVLAWLPEAGRRPLFVWVHLFDAHIPYEPPPDVLARFWDAARDPHEGSLPEGIPVDVLPPSLKDVTDLEYPKAAYRAEISAQDAVFERLLAAPRFANGITAFVADHGESLGEDGLFFRHEGVLPSVLHVPLVLAGRGVPAGLRSPARVTHTDVGRTLLDLAGLHDAPFPGRSLLDQVDPARARAPRFALEAYGRSASVEVDGLLCVLHLFARDTTYVLVPHATHEVQLFDVDADTSCQHDLLEERFDDAARLRGLLLDWLAAADPDGLADHEVSLDDAQLEALESLGYVQPGDSGTEFFAPDDCAWCRRFEEP